MRKAALALVLLAACAGARPTSRAAPNDTSATKPAPSAGASSTPTAPPRPPICSSEARASMDAAIERALTEVKKRKEEILVPNRAVRELEKGAKVAVATDPTATTLALVCTEGPVELPETGRAKKVPAWAEDVSKGLAGSCWHAAVYAPMASNVEYTANGCVGELVLEVVDPKLVAQERARDAAAAIESMRQRCGAGVTNACVARGCQMVEQPSCPGGRPPELEPQGPPRCDCMCGGPVARAKCSPRP